MRRGFARELCHPLSLGALALLLANDHLFKGAGVLPGWLTGKLSDVAGLFVFPLLLVAVARLVLGALGLGRHSDRRGIIDGAALATLVGFAALKLSASLNQALTDVWGVNLMDPTDLIALPAVACAWLLATTMRRARHGRPTRLREGLIVGVAAMASIATPAPMYPRNYPAWNIQSGDTRSLGCGQARAWVSKSGKTGVGLSISISSTAQHCRVGFERAELAIEGGPVVSASRMPNPGDSLLYIPFPFDNNGMWNRKLRSGRFTLAMTVNGAPVVWTMPAVHRLDGFHVRKPRRYQPPRRYQAR
jgi:hypothetical protein